ncbi:response regulator transcription factor [Nitrogeniibacter mangrovi]|uniref:Response regulator transcription factor n=1 Tax=Nitrogeniibacter mangrovi TaxID=2016596 RepID=A0A6C1B0B0_9RHOO|nr:response regulator [Nitrogeniibacter mangrovi]QID16813.1 response regulator transcription factor [Nitrogeniibacter mangrovi]
MNEICHNEPTVFIVDDDAGVRRSVRMLMESAGHAATTFDSAEAFLHAYRPEWRGCLILDVNMGAMSGTTLHQTLNARRIALPIIYLTAHGDVPSAVQAMRRGAVDFLIKPVRGPVLLAQVEAALAAQHRADPAPAAPALDGLTPREIEIAERALAGLGNKEIARQLGISHRTVEYHRTQILHKTGASSFLQLASRLAAPDDEGAASGA